MTTVLRSGFCAISCVLLSHHPAFAAGRSCESLSSQALPNTTISLAESVAAGSFMPPAADGGRGAAQGEAFRSLPAFCRVAATLKPTSDSDIKMEVWMPASGWNGKFQAVGNGGWGGAISYAAMGEALRRGYATSSTDTGHAGGSGSFALGHPEKLIDYAYRSEHEMTLKAKAIIAAYFGDAPKRSYWNGCSAGGRQGLKEAQRFPEDFDGIIAGAPAADWTGRAAASVRVAQAVHKDEASYIPPTMFPLVHNAVLAACERWQTGAAVIGSVTDSARLVVRSGERIEADVPVSALVDACPLYDLDPADPNGWIYGNERTLEEDASATEILEALLASATIASKRWAYEQYDSIVGSRTMRRPGDADAAVLSIPEAGCAIAVAIDGNGRRVACDPYVGAVEAVLECAANLACAGAEPLGLTNCLNFGSPEESHVAWQLERAVAGLADACEALGVPVVGGNVSLYNGWEEGPIYPTPIVGLVGELGEPRRAAGIAWQAGDAIALIGAPAGSLAGSELAKLRGELGRGLPEPDLPAALQATRFVRDAVRSGAASGAHDVSDGGLACALAECAIAGGVGAEVGLSPPGDPDATLFGEGPGRFVLAGEPAAVNDLVSEANEAGLKAGVIGSATGEAIEVYAASARVELSLERAAAAWASLADRMAGASAAA